LTIPYSSLSSRASNVQKGRASTHVALWAAISFCIPSVVDNNNLKQKFKKNLKDIQPILKMAHFLTVLAVEAETNKRIHFIHRGMLDTEKNQRTNPNYSFISFSVCQICTLLVQNWQNLAKLTTLVLFCRCNTSHGSEKCTKTSQLI
jgi:hypothetical protein